MTNRKNWLPAVSTCWKGLHPDVYHALAKVGIRHVELDFGSRETLENVDFLHNAVRIAEEMKACGIAPSSLHLPFSPFEDLDPTAADASAREKIAAYQSEVLKAAAQIDVPIAVIHPSGEPYGAFERGERMKCALDTLNRIARTAQDCGIKLAVENLPRTCLGNIHEEIKLMTMEIPSLSVCFDMNHSLRQKNTDCIRALGSKIITLHLSDYDMIDERHLLPFLGRNDWHGIMQALEEIDYDGFLTFEVSAKGVLTEDCLRLAYDKLMEI